ncbi:MAG: phasin family protein [Pseudomonadota bacterium]
MFTNPEQFASATKALFEFQLETFNTLTSKAVQGVEQVVALNLATAKSGVESSMATSKEISQARDPKAVLAVAAAKVQPGVADAAAYNQQLGGIIADIREEFTRAADAHMTEAKSTLSALIYDVTKNVRPGSENAVQIVKTAIDNAFAGYEQVTNATRQAVANVEAQIAKASAIVEQPEAAAKASKK